MDEDNRDSILYILSRPQVWKVRYHSLIPGRGRDFSLFQCAHASSGSHPASCSVSMGVAWHQAARSCPFTVVLKLSVCVWSRTSTPLNACMACTGTTLQVPFFTENTELDSSLKSGFYILIVEFVSIFFSWTQMTVFFVPWIGGLVAASFYGLVWTAVAFRATQFEAFRMMLGRSIWSPNFSSKRADFFFLSSHPRFCRSQNLSLLWLGMLSQKREKVCTIFICFFFWGSIHCFWCTWTCVCTAETQSWS